MLIIANSYPKLLFSVFINIRWIDKRIRKPERKRLGFLAKALADLNSSSFYQQVVLYKDKTIRMKTWGNINHKDIGNPGNL